MFYKVKDLHGYRIRATDGELGHFQEVFFDDNEWRVRYFVVKTGTWLTGRDVLIAPASVTGIDQAARDIAVNLTRDKVKDSPDIRTDVPITRLHEMDLHRHYGWPQYWSSGYPIRPGMSYPFGVPYGFAGPVAAPATPEPTEPETSVDQEVEAAEDQARESHLRSSHDTTGYRLATADGEIGRVDDFIIDDENWFVRYLVVDAGRVLSGHKVLLAPEWIESINWDDKHVYVNLPKAEIANSPVYDPSQPISRDYETRIFENYHRQGYWEMTDTSQSKKA